MLFTRLYDRKLAQASYLIGCQATGDTLVVDPNRDAAQYLAAAAAERVRITHVTETHIHADFVSGARELASRTRAKLLLSGEGGADWQYGFAKESGAQLLKDGDTFMIGRLRVDVVHTPGHTPEHLMFIVTDVPASPHPVIALTGDFVFVGDVGRPDLLEKAARQADTMDASARALWRSLSKFRALPPHVQVWPGHGAGSACGKALGAVPSSTVGYETLSNWGLAAPGEEAFVSMVLEGQPEPPAYFARMKRVNRDGPALIGDVATPATLEASAVDAPGTIVLDVRPVDAFARGHVPGAINVPHTKSFTTYAGSALPFDVPIVLVTGDASGGMARDVARDLSLIGFDTITGHVPWEALASRGNLATMDRFGAPDAIAKHAAGTMLLDVRNSSEWALRHVPGARHIPFPQLAERTGELPKGIPFLIYCESGARSAIATSMLTRLGFDAMDGGGIQAWQRSGGPVEAAHGS